MYAKKLFFPLVVALLACLQVRGQRFPEHPELATGSNAGSVVLTHLNFGAQIPGGDLADRFGPSGSLGAGLEWLTAGNWALGLDGYYFFGGKVKEDPLSILRTPEGNLIGNDQQIADVALRQRGYYLGASLGKLFPVGKQRSGIRISLGAGWLRHKIRVQDNNNSLVQVAGAYGKGYDRLSGGLALQQFIGWQHLSLSRRSNWMAGFTFGQGFTESLRSWDFSSMGRLEGRRTDLQFGIRLSWTLPFYQGNADKIYY